MTLNLASSSFGVRKGSQFGRFGGELTNFLVIGAHSQRVLVDQMVQGIFRFHQNCKLFTDTGLLETHNRLDHYSQRQRISIY